MPKTKKPKSVYISERYERLAFEILEKEDPNNERWDLEKGDVIFLQCDGFEKAKWLGRCRNVGQPWSTLIPDACYIIEMNEDAIGISGFDEEQIRLLMYHELMHIPSEGTYEDSKNYKKLVRHDLNEFSAILQAAGINYFDWRVKSPAKVESNG